MDPTAWTCATSSEPGARAQGHRRSDFTLLSFRPPEGRLVNQWAADYTHAIAGGIPLLALDIYEHAYHLDFGAAAGEYVEAFMQNIDWAKVYERYQQAVTGASGELGATAEEAASARPLDVRRAGVFEQSDVLAEDAEWRNPPQVDAWATQILAGTPVVVYCVYGHEVWGYRIVGTAEWRPHTSDSARACSKEVTVIGGVRAFGTGDERRDPDAAAL